MRPIDADALPVHKAYCVDEAGFGATFYVVDKSDIDNAPTIDAVPVVRCKECKHFVQCKEVEGVSWTGFCNYGEFHTDEEDFCSRGERRSE